MTEYGLSFSHFAVAGEGWLPLVAFGNLPGLLAAAAAADVNHSPRSLSLLDQASSGGLTGGGVHSATLGVGTSTLPAH